MSNLTKNKKGFALITVLFLLVGISIAATGLTYKIVYESRLVSIWANRDMALPTAETGMESAKRWLISNVESELPESETVSNVCIKGFKDNLEQYIQNIASIHEYKANLSDELSLDNENATGNQEDSFKDSFFEYYIEDVSDEYNNYTNNQNEQPSSKNYIYEYWRSNIAVIDSFTGEFSNEHPTYKTPIWNDEKSGYKLPLWGSVVGHSGDIWLINDKYMYTLCSNCHGGGGPHIYVWDKMTGLPSNQHPKLTDTYYNRRYNASGFKIKRTGGVYLGYSGLSGMVIDDQYIYIRVARAVHVYDKMTGEDSIEHNKIETFFGETASGFSLDLGVVVGVEWNDYNSVNMAIDNNYLYDFHNFLVLVYDKITGIPIQQFETFDASSINPQPRGLPFYLNYGGIIIEQFSSGLITSKYRTYSLINGDHIYLISYESKNTVYIRVFDKLTGKPSKEHPPLNHANGYTSSGYELTGNFGSHSKQEIDISGNFLYIKDGAYVTVYDKMTGNISNKHPIITEVKRTCYGDVPIDNYAGFLMKDGPYLTNCYSTFIVDGDAPSQPIISDPFYFRLYSCGYGSNNTISRIETVLSVSSDLKIKQISWREHF